MKPLALLLIALALPAGALAQGGRAAPPRIIDAHMHAELGPGTAALLEEEWARNGVVGAVAVTVCVMLVVIFARRLALAPGLEWLEPVGRLAWPWYVPLGTTLAFGTGVLLSYLPSRGNT